MSACVRLRLPASLRSIGGIDGELRLALDGEPTMQAVLDRLEQLHPALRGTLREPATGRRRAFVRFFACREDLSHDPLDAPLPAAVAAGTEPVVVIGAIAGG
jgi:molybdopterin synthase sulfur carrier subunit